MDFLYDFSWISCEAILKNKKNRKNITFSLTVMKIVVLLQCSI